jgi:hypothetical protein
VIPLTLGICLKGYFAVVLSAYDGRIRNRRTLVDNGNAVVSKCGEFHFSFPPNSEPISTMKRPMPAIYLSTYQYF